MGPRFPCGSALRMRNAAIPCGMAGARGMAGAPRDGCSALTAAIPCGDCGGPSAPLWLRFPHAERGHPVRDGWSTRDGWSALTTAIPCGIAEPEYKGLLEKKGMAGALCACGMAGALCACGIAGALCARGMAGALWVCSNPLRFRLRTKGHSSAPLLNMSAWVSGQWRDVATTVPQLPHFRAYRGCCSADRDFAYHTE